MKEPVTKICDMLDSVRQLTRNLNEVTHAIHTALSVPQDPAIEKLLTDALTTLQEITR